jgi:hypothetical protein
VDPDPAAAAVPAEVGAEQQVAVQKCSHFSICLSIYIYIYVSCYFVLTNTVFLNTTSGSRKLPEYLIFASHDKFKSDGRYNRLNSEQWEGMSNRSRRGTMKVFVNYDIDYKIQIS